MAGELGWNEADPRASLNKLIEWHIQVALDPRVSDRAPAQAVDALTPERIRDLAITHGVIAFHEDPKLTAFAHAVVRAALAAQPAAPVEPGTEDRSHWTARQRLEHGIKGREPWEFVNVGVANLSAVLAELSVDAAAGELVEYQYRMRGDWQTDEQWGEWTKTTKGSYEDYKRTPRNHNWVYEVRELYATPVANAGQAQDENADAEACSSCGLTMGESRTLAALRQQAAQAVAVPDGWRLVPVKPSEAMSQAVFEEMGSPSDWHGMDEAYAAMLAAAPLPQQVAQTDTGIPVSRQTSRDAYLNMTPERRAAFDADMTKLDQRIAEHRRSRDRRTHDEPVAEERRHGDRRHVERRDCED